MRLAYVSSVPCARTFGGPLQIYRHFVDRNDFEFFDFSDDSTDIFEQWLGEERAKSPLFQRLKRTRLYPYLLAAAYTTLLGHRVKELVPEIAALRPDAIVTVAYGRYAFVAQRIAKKMKLPLVTFFHDWWPDLVFCSTPKTRYWMDKKIRALAKASDLLLSVSDGLLQELDPHPFAVVLLPIPANPTLLLNSPQNGIQQDPKLPVLVYCGTLEGDYGAMIRAIGYELLSASNPTWSLRFYGRAADWSEKDRHLFLEAGLYGGDFVNQGDEQNHTLTHANALLVVMDFEEKYRRRARTSFPSKILDYARFGKPMVIWGPKDCTAVVFAKQKNAAHVVDNLNPQALLKGVRALFSDAEQCLSLGQVSLELSQTIFNADIIHLELKTHIAKLLNHE
jgi:hypothetical protein